MKRSRWRVIEGIQLTEPGQPRESLVERGDETEEAYSDARPGHQEQALAVADALNRLEAELSAPTTSKGRNRPAT